MDHDCYVVNVMNKNYIISKLQKTQKDNLNSQNHVKTDNLRTRNPFKKLKNMRNDYVTCTM